MIVLRVLRKIAVKSRRATLVVKKFAGPLKPSERGGIDQRLSMPPCVWYGRSVSCFYLPVPPPLKEPDESMLDSGEGP